MSIKREGFQFLPAYLQHWSGQEPIHAVSPSPSIILCEIKHAISSLDKLRKHCRNLSTSFKAHTVFPLGLLKHKPLPLL